MRSDWKGAKVLVVSDIGEVRRMISEFESEVLIPY